TEETASTINDRTEESTDTSTDVSSGNTNDPDSSSSTFEGTNHTEETASTGNDRTESSSGNTNDSDPGPSTVEITPSEDQNNDTGRNGTEENTAPSTIYPVNTTDTSEFSSMTSADDSGTGLSTTVSSGKEESTTIAPAVNSSNCSTVSVITSTMRMPDRTSTRTAFPSSVSLFSSSSIISSSRLVTTVPVPKSDSNAACTFMALTLIWLANVKYIFGGVLCSIFTLYTFRVGINGCANDKNPCSGKTPFCESLNGSYKCHPSPCDDKPCSGYATCTAKSYNQHVCECSWIYSNPDCGFRKFYA
ncbi:unnamed protein product, partial [Enterobius vermicularis]|uniref:EGF-like domain-containing protein n=1 Tax=Enterobius vermicularis TaxID=51028 RepID=A0A0N4VCD2_ENTVE